MLKRSLEKSKLSIPYGINREAENKWRFKLLRKTKLYDFRELKKDIEYDFIKNLPKERKAYWIDVAKSDEFRLDDIDKAVLYIAPMIEYYISIPDKHLIDINFSFFEFLYETPEELKVWRSSPYIFGQNFSC